MNRFDEATFLQAVKNRDCAIAENMPFAGKAGHGLDFAICLSFVVNGPATGQYVQRALFKF